MAWTDKRVISFDFKALQDDEGLPNWSTIRQMQEHQVTGDLVIIVTDSGLTQGVQASTFVLKHDLPARFILSVEESKTDLLAKLGVIKHFDTDQHDLDALPSTIEGVLVSAPSPENRQAEREQSFYVFTEDRDLETGHGWRSQPHVVEDGQVRILDSEGAGWTRWSPDTSYCWIVLRSEWAQYKGRTAGELRTRDILRVHPGFKGGDDMEGHFEFEMTPSEMLAHLEDIGMGHT